MNDRNHKECQECALQHLSPTRCKGHTPGLTVCKHFQMREDGQLVDTATTLGIAQGMTDGPPPAYPAKEEENRDHLLRALKSEIPDRYINIKRDDIKNEDSTIKECRATPTGSIFLTGVGMTGKTMIASIWLRHRVLTPGMKPEIGEKLKWVNTSELLIDLRGTMGRSKGPKEWDVLSGIWKNKAIVIDDLGAESVTDYTKTSMYVLLNRLCEMNRQVFITSNLSLVQIAKEIGPRISDRIARMCTEVRMQQQQAWRKE